jgi:hypothetical protein
MSTAASDFSKWTILEIGGKYIFRGSSIRATNKTFMSNLQHIYSVFKTKVVAKAMYNMLHGSSVGPPKNEEDFLFLDDSEAFQYYDMENMSRDIIWMMIRAVSMPTVLNLSVYSLNTTRYTDIFANKEYVRRTIQDSLVRGELCLYALLPGNSTAK